MVELLDTETQRTGVSYSKRQQKRKRKEQAFPTRRKKRFVCPFECFFACLLQKNVSRIIYWFQTTFVIIVRSSVFLPASCKKMYRERCFFASRNEDAKMLASSTRRDKTLQKYLRLVRSSVFLRLDTEP